MNENKLRRVLPNISESVLKLNRDHVEIKQGFAELKQIIQHQPLGQVQGTQGDTKRVVVSISCVRKRLLDEDDQCEKYFIDGLRYAGLLRGDSAKETHIPRPTQRLCKEGEEEHTTITIIYPKA